jgi:hypothetical protein
VSTISLGIVGKGLWKRLAITHPTAYTFDSRQIDYIAVAPLDTESTLEKGSKGSRSEKNGVAVMSVVRFEMILSDLIYTVLLRALLFFLRILILRRTQCGRLEIEGEGGGR